MPRHLRTSPSPSLNGRSQIKWSSVSLRKAARRARVPIGTIVTIGFLLFARPTWSSLAISLPFALAGLGLRAWAAGTLRKKEALATTGPYAYTRNPLYLGSTLLAASVAVAGGAWPFAVALAIVFYGIYRPTIIDEEQFLSKRYAGFDEYMEKVPRLLPRLTPAYRGEGNDFSPTVYRKNREYQALIGAIALYAALIARIVVEHRR